MGRSKYRGGDNDEAYEKVGKMRSRSKVRVSKKSDLKGSFELPEAKWPKVDGSFAGRVVEVHKRYCFVSSEPKVGEIDTSDVWLARIARKYLTIDRRQRNFVCVGDRVQCLPADADDLGESSDLPQCIITQLAPRKSKLSRNDPARVGREHILATNVDQILVVSSFLNPRVKWGLIDRYIVLAELQGVDIIIVLNKLDTLQAKEQSDARFYQESLERVAYYRQLGYKVCVLQANAEQARQSEAAQELGDHLRNKVSLFSGHSGVGKSSIVNLFRPEIEQDVEPDSDIFYKGRHTTTFASFIRLNDVSAYVIDTPGIRSFAIQERSAIDLSYGFRDIRQYRDQCKFRECRHIDEPECAVREAVDKGVIPEWRYKNYTGILLGTTGREGRLLDQLDGPDPE